MNSANAVGVKDLTGANGTDVKTSFTAVPALPSEAMLVGLLLLVTLLCCVNILSNGFVYDDDQQVLQNPYIRSWRFLPQIFGTTVWSFVGEAGATNYYRPLMTLSFLLLWKVFGPIPFGFHLFSLVLHAAVVVMVFYTGLKIFLDWRVAWLGALLFAVHPVHTEAVDWVSAYPDLEVAFFCLAAFCFFARSAKTDWKQRSVLASLFALALLSKEPALMLVPLAILFEHAVRPDCAVTTLRDKVSRYLPLGVVGVAYLLLRIALFGKLAPVLQHPQISWLQSVYSAFALVSSYLRLLVWPTRLSAFHEFHPSSSLAQLNVLTGILVLILSLGAVVILRKKSPAAAFSIFWIGITLLPVLNARWMAANVLTERYLYLPSAGFCWLAAWLAIQAWDSFSKIRVRLYSAPLRIALCAGLLLLCVYWSAATIARNRDWQDDETLYTRTLQTDPHAYPILLNLGVWYHQKDDLQQAEREYKLALVERPDGVNVLNALGVLYLKQNRDDQATEMFERAIAVKPIWADPHFNYGRLLEKLGKKREALVEFQTATRLAPLNPLAHLFYADALIASSRFDEAESEYKKSEDLSSSLEAEHGLVESYLRDANDQAAEALLRKVVAGNPYDSLAHLTLGRLLERSNRAGEALAEYQKTLNTDPNNVEAQEAVKRLKKS
jgi:protein O-mannosyl-transferase